MLSTIIIDFWKIFIFVCVLRMMFDKTLALDKLKKIGTHSGIIISDTSRVQKIISKILQHFLSLL